MLQGNRSLAFFVQAVDLYDHAHGLFCIILCTYMPWIVTYKKEQMEQIMFNADYLFVIFRALGLRLCINRVSITHDHWQVWNWLLKMKFFFAPWSILWIQQFFFVSSRRDTAINYGLLSHSAVFPPLAADIFHIILWNVGGKYHCHCFSRHSVQKYEFQVTSGWKDLIRSQEKQTWLKISSC